MIKPTSHPASKQRFFLSFRSSNFGAGQWCCSTLPLQEPVLQPFIFPLPFTVLYTFCQKRNSFSYFPCYIMGNTRPESWRMPVFFCFFFYSYLFARTSPATRSAFLTLATLDVLNLQKALHVLSWTFQQLQPLTVLNSQLNHTSTF